MNEGRRQNLRTLMVDEAISTAPNVASRIRATVGRCLKMIRLGYSQR